MWWNAFLLALREIKRNVMRSFLTILGIVIGVAAVITMVTIGSGATVQVTQQIASLGSNILQVRVGQRTGFGQSVTAPPFRLDDVEAIRREVNAISGAAPYVSLPITAIFGNENWYTAVVGSDNEFFKVGNWQFQSGREFTDTEIRAGSAVCILGASLRNELFGAQDPLGSKIRLKKLSCQVIGLLQAKGESAMGRDQDDIVVLPLKTFQRRISGNQDISLIRISVREGVRTQKVQSELERLLRERRHISATEEDDFTVMDMKEIAERLTSTTEVLTGLLGAVAAVSLLVGGIGIMNIMLVSVTERTREIGIRLAIGAQEREVLMQFLVEAVVLSSFGGIIGIVLALVASLALTNMLNVPFVMDFNVVMLAFLFSAMVGVIFGYFPARKAARLDPIDALRHE
jgi:putative ABC transport system permease protein